MPTAAPALWQGNMGSFTHFSAFSGGGASSPGPQGQPPGSYVPQQIGRNNSSSGVDAPIATNQRASGVPQSQPSQEGSGMMERANQNPNRFT